MGSATGSPIIGLPLQHLGAYSDCEARGTRYMAVPPGNGEFTIWHCECFWPAVSIRNTNKAACLLGLNLIKGVHARVKEASLRVCGRQVVV